MRHRCLVAALYLCVRNKVHHLQLPQAPPAASSFTVQCQVRQPVRLFRARVSLWEGVSQPCQPVVTWYGHEEMPYGNVALGPFVWAFLNEETTSYDTTYYVEKRCIKDAADNRLAVRVSC